MFMNKSSEFVEAQALSFLKSFDIVLTPKKAKTAWALAVWPFFRGVASLIASHWFMSLEFWPHMCNL